jgi:hypothetical protein
MTTYNIRQVKGRRAGLFVVDNVFVNRIAHFCKPAAICVYLSLCRHANNKTQECFPSEKLIAQENGIGISTVKKSIKKLEKLNLVFVHRSRRMNGTRNVNIYTLLDVREWEYPSEGNKAIAIKLSPPEVRNVKSHSLKLTNKDTKNTKDTNYKEVLSEQEDKNSFLEALRADRKKLSNKYTPL